MLNKNSFAIKTVLFDHTLEIDVHLYNVCMVEAYIDFSLYMTIIVENEHGYSGCIK